MIDGGMVVDKELYKFEDQIYAQVTDNITAYIKSYADSQSMISDLKAISVEKNKYISQLESENHNYSEIVDNLKKVLVEKKQELKEAEEDLQLLNEIKSDSLKLSVLINDEQEKIKQLEIEKQEYEEARKKIVDENERLKSNLKAKEKALSDCQHNFDSEVVNHRKDCDEKEKIISEKDKVITSLNVQIEELNADTDKLNEENESLKRKIGKMEAEIKELSDECEAHKSDKHDEELQAAIKKISDLQSDVDWLIGYAKATDEKVRKYFRGDTSDLNGHNKWLCNQPKDQQFKRLFGISNDNDENYVRDCNSPTNITKMQNSSPAKDASEHTVAEQKSNKFNKTVV